MAGKVISRFQSGSGIHLISSTFYGTCNTAADVAVKQVEINDEHVTELKLIPGMLLSVKFTNGNTVTNPQLKILDSNNNVLKNAILIAPDTLTWGAGNVLLFVYDNNNNNERGISNYLSLSGGTLTGKLNIQDNNIDIATTSSSNQYSSVFEILDSSEKQIMNITDVHEVTGNYHGFSIGTYDSETGQQNTLQLSQNNNDGYKVGISQPAAGRSALGVGTIGLKNSLAASDIPSLPYLPTSGGTVSGGNIIAKSTNIKDGTRPSSDTVGNARLLFNGSDNNGLGWVDFMNGANGVQAIRLYARRIISSTTHYAGLVLGMDSSGNATVAIQGTNTQSAWRSAIGVGTIGTKNSLAASDIPSLAASKITSGTLGIARGGTGSSQVVSIVNDSTLTIFAWGPLVMVQLHGFELAPGISTAISSTAYLASYKPEYNVSALVSGPENNDRIARLWVGKDDGKVYLNAVNTTTRTAWYGTLVYMRVPT